TEGGSDFAQDSHRPADAVVTGEDRQDLTLFMVDGEATNTFCQSGCGPVRFQAQLQIERKERARARFAALVAVAAVRHRAERGGDGLGLFRWAAIGVSRKGNAGACLLHAVGFELAHRLLQQTLSRGTQDALQLRFQIKEAGGPDGFSAELIERLLQLLQLWPQEANDFGDSCACLRRRGTGTFSHGESFPSRGWLLVTPSGRKGPC